MSHSYIKLASFHFQFESEYKKNHFFRCNNKWILYDDAFQIIFPWSVYIFAYKTIFYFIGFTSYEAPAGHTSYGIPAAPHPSSSYGAPIPSSHSYSTHTTHDHAYLPPSSSHSSSYSGPPSLSYGVASLEGPSSSYGNPHHEGMFFFN